MFKKVVLSIISIFLITLLALPVSAYTAGETLKSFGAISGDQYGNLNEGMKLSRAEMAVVLASLNGKSTEAKNFKLHSTFNDVPLDAWYAPYVAYAEAMGWTKGVGGGKYAPNADVTIKESAAFLMNALGKKYDYATVIAEANEAGIRNGLSGEGAILRADLFTAMIDVLNIIPEGKSKQLGEILGYFKTTATPVVPAVVKNVEVATSKSFHIIFLEDVADRSKISVTVTRLSTVIPVTATWNDAKNSMILVSDSELGSGAYEISVFENSLAVAKKSVLIEDRHIEKIEVVSPSVNIVSTITSTRGYAVYRIYDQYGEDMTNEVKASDLVFSSSAGTAQGGAGGVIITPFSNSYLIVSNPSITLSILESRTGISTSATLPVNVGVSTLSELKLGTINDIQNGSATSINIPYQAYDSFGFATKNYDIITAGLLDMNNLGLADQTVDLINQANGAGIKVEIVRDDADQSKALIKLTPGNVPLSADTYVTITANLISGKSSSKTVKVLH